MRPHHFPAYFLLASLAVLVTGCGVFTGLSEWIGGHSLLVERGAVVTCAGADGAMDVLVKGNKAAIVPNSVLLGLDPARGKVVPVCSNPDGITGGLTPDVLVAITALNRAKSAAIAKMPPKSLGSFVDQLIDLILEGAPSKVKVDAARLAMQADLSLTVKRWDERIIVIAN